MIKFETKTLGTVRLDFYHSLPSVTVPGCKNDLVGMLRNLKITKGKTECKLTFGSVNFFGLAYTHPHDQYNKEVGRKVSLERAIKVAALSPKEEREVLVGYLSR